MEKICLRKVVRLHGYLGQMKISTKYDKDFDIKKIEKIYDENDNEFLVKKIFQVKDGVVVMLDGVTLETAKSMINTSLFIERSLVSGKILIEDLKNSFVYFENEETAFGKITDVQDYGAAEVFYLKTDDGKEILFPNVKELIVGFDYKTKKLVLNKTRFLEVTDEDWYTHTFSK